MGTNRQLYIYRLTSVWYNLFHKDKIKGVVALNVMKYDNSMNNLRLGSFSESETDIFFSLLLKANNCSEDSIIINFSELKTLSQGDKNNDRFLKNILGLNTKLKAMNQTIELENGVFLTFSLFGNILTDTNKKIVEVPIDPRFKCLIHNLVGNFTMFDLRELVGLKGNYPKVLFRLLKQWEFTKKYIVKMEEFKELLDIPEKYAQRNIDQKVLTPCIEQLGNHFTNLKVEKIKKGVKIDSLKFSWTAERKDPSIKIHEAFVERKQGADKEDYPELFEIKDSLELLKINIIGSTKGQVPRKNELKFIIAVTNAENEFELRDICELYGATFDFNGSHEKF